MPRRSPRHWTLSVGMPVRYYRLAERLVRAGRYESVDAVVAAALDRLETKLREERIEAIADRKGGRQRKSRQANIVSKRAR